MMRPAHNERIVLGQWDSSDSLYSMQMTRLQCLEILNPTLSPRVKLASLKNVRVQRVQPVRDLLVQGSSSVL